MLKAAERGDVGEVKLWLEQGLRVNWKNKVGIPLRAIPARSVGVPGMPPIVAWG
jgi:hypothetical protein